MNIAAGVLLDGIASAMILYVIAVGLSVTMGLIVFVKPAHCVFAMARGYLTIWAPNVKRKHMNCYGPMTTGMGLIFMIDA